MLTEKHIKGKRKDLYKNVIDSVVSCFEKLRRKRPDLIIGFMRILFSFPYGRVTGSSPVESENSSISLESS